ncbi:MAG: hypothetical protein ACIAQZ_00080 [Sedimentisphaeraceae bacterium JB056]
MKKIFMMILMLSVLLGGCSVFKTAPDASQKTNAYLLSKTIGKVSDAACEKEGSEEICQLARLADKQTDAVLEYYGVTKDETELAAGQLLDARVREISQTAYENASASNTATGSVNELLDIAIGICGLCGGAFGIKAVSFLNNAKNKAVALEEIICGNEKFKAEYPKYSELFKQSQSGQSKTTKELVTNIKDNA